MTDSSCSHEAHHHHHHHHQHDHQDTQPDQGTQDFLYSKIDLDQLVGYNLDPNHPAKDSIKPWNQRAELDRFTQSDLDHQIIIQIPFTGSVKLRTVIIRTLPGEFRLTHAHLYPNQPDLDFDTLESLKPTQVLEIPETSEIVEFPVRVAKFSSLTSLSIFFTSTLPNSSLVDQADHPSRIYFLGFKGEFSTLSRKPVIAVYEAQANPSDHQKIAGMGDSIDRTI